ncbi:type IV secretory system conjugative DNA transfer family protein [Halomicrococcus sp. SG-WS-1]|uniref:type IV secretory system conjugative DNA transfer family protein n=1 Tax=Halomicrococcus sp. SG-WS-1 TaxID=3439057 RepID=UPI003F7A525E
MPTPDRPEPTPYLRIRPTTDPINPKAAVTQFQRLHTLATSDDTRSTTRRLLLPGSGGDSGTIEWLLVATPDEPLDYFVTLHRDDAEPSALEGVLRNCVPDSYEVDNYDLVLDDILGLDTHEISSDSTPASESEPGNDTDHFVAGVEFHGRGDRHKDWQTQLTPFSDFTTTTGGETRAPLAPVVETLADTDATVVFQILLRPKDDWTVEADLRQHKLANGREESFVGRAVSELLVPPDSQDESTQTDRPPETTRRIEELDAKDARHSFDVNVRAVAVADDATTATQPVEDVASALTPLGHSCYTIDATTHPADPERPHATDEDLSRWQSPTPAAQLLESIRSREMHTPSTGIRTRLPGKTSSPAIVADATEAPGFCLLDGSALTAAGRRALAPTPDERTSLPRPPIDQLDAYHGDGFLLGYPLTQDGTPHSKPISLPPAFQPLHSVLLGKTGSGKTTLAINGLLDNHAATEGATVIVEPKGDGMTTDYLRAHYARFGHLDDVLYFDCASVLPAFSFFDIEDELAAGVTRTTAVEDRVDHYIEILTQIMGRERFQQAVRSPDIIRYLVKAMFDPVHGSDAFSHRSLHGAARRMHERQSAPAVSDSDLERMLGGVVANRAQTFDELMQGVANRMEKIPVDKRLARMFDHVPDEGDPEFDLADYLSEDVVIIFDTGDLRTEAQRVLALVVLSNLWTALRRRARREPDAEQPLVNLYLEEAASLAVTDVLNDLLAQSRSFDCAVTLAMQFPAQLRGLDKRAYDEVLNNISTFVTGNVAVDRPLAERLSTASMDTQTVGNRLRALQRGQWLVKLPAAFDDPEPRPFLVRSAPLPPGDPEGNEPLSETESVLFQSAMFRVSERTRRNAGLTIGTPETVEEDGEDDEEPTNADESQVRVDTALPHTKRLPSCIEYDASLNALRCTSCDNRYDPSIEGMKRAIACCSSLDAVDRDDIPICDLNLKLTPEERSDAAWSDHQLMFLQAVYNAQQLRYDSLEYDLLYDSMLRLQEYVGIDSDAVQDLIDADLLRHDTDHPHRLYTVTPDGRSVIGESYRQGVDYGHGQGDLEESSQHVFAIEVARQHLETAYVDDPESAVSEVVPYYDIDEQRRLDIAGLDDDGSIVVAVEAERVNHDVRRAVPDDFDKIADCDVEEALWVVMTQSAGHDVLAALNDPPEGEPRVEKTYSKTTPPQQFRLDTPGMTAMYPIEWLRDRLETESDS